MRNSSAAALFLLFVASAALHSDRPVANAQVAKESGWVVKRFEVTFAMQETGSVDVHEVIMVDFGKLSKHGIFRNLVTHRMCGDEDWYCPPGVYRVYDFSQVRVTDAAGDDLPFSVSETKYGPSYRIGDPARFAPPKMEYHIRYTLRYAVNPNHVDFDFPWDVTGYWPVAIEWASARVTLPGGAAAFSSRCDRLAPRFIESCATSVTPDGATFGPVSLDVSEQLVIHAAFPMDIMSEVEIKTGSVESEFMRPAHRVTGAVNHVLSVMFSLFREERVPLMSWGPRPARPTPLPPRREATVEGKPR